MDLFDSKSAALIAALQRERVAYLLVGGYAVNIHGYSRGTGDMDIWIRPTTENVLRLIAAFESCGYEVGGLAEYAPQVPTQGLSLRVTDEPFVLDVMTQLSGLTFEAAYAQHKTYDLDGPHPPQRFDNKQAHQRPRQRSGRCGKPPVRGGVLERPQAGGLRKASFTGGPSGRRQKARRYCFGLVDGTISNQ